MAKPYKKYLPRSLFGRALLILLAPIVLLQLVVAGLFIKDHYAGVTQQMTSAVAQELIFAVEEVEGAPDVPSARALIERLAQPLGVTLALDPGAQLAPEAAQKIYEISGNALAATLRDQIDRPISVDLLGYGGDIEVRIETEKGILRALIPRRRVIASNPHILLVWMVATSLLLTVVAVLFLRNQVRPIRQLAVAAEGFGKGRATPFRPAGAEEVRRAGAAFLDMRRRVERAMESRTNFLNGVSHDLRTPLTRMKLALAMMEEEDAPEAAELKRDVDEMERMLGEFLAYARGETGEEAAPTDPASLLEAAAADARRGGACVTTRVSEDSAPVEEVTIRAGAVRRALTNLLENAARYGTQAQATVRLGRSFVEFAVEDDGPGIPEDKRELAFRPFSRLDDARNQDRGGGVGLGLAIAQDIARAHGGAISLEDSPRLGGLRAVLRLPR